MWASFAIRTSTVIGTIAATVLFVVVFRPDSRTGDLPASRETMTIFVAGDVMTGRAIDQVMPHANHPRLYEIVVKNARNYVQLAEAKNGSINQPVDFSYVWGCALDELARFQPDARIVNLETAVTTSDRRWRSKPVHFRMHPKNVACLRAAKIDCCVLANNHVLDWGREGFDQTLQTLHRAGIKTAGAGRDRRRAEAPAILDVGDHARVLVFAIGFQTSLIPAEWATSKNGPGVNLLPDFSTQTAQSLAKRIRDTKMPGDIAIVSIHWGPNWGRRIDRDERSFAHRLINDGGVDMVHGHSSHHPRAIEVYRDRLILYGCGDLINDYEGIGGHEEFRKDLGLMYFVKVDRTTGTLVELKMVPTQVRNFRINRPPINDVNWLRAVLNRECRKFGTSLKIDERGSLTLDWPTRK